MQALIPMRMLINMGGVPFSGEFSGSDTGINAEALSGEALTLHWEETSSIFHLKQFYHDASTRLLVNWLYASKKEGYWESEKEFDPKVSWERASPTYVRKLCNEAAKHRFWIVLQVDILRLRLTDQEADRKLEPLRQEIQQLLNLSSSSNEVKEELHSLLKALDTKVSYHLSPEDLKVIQAPAYPVILASTTAEREELGGGMEHLAKGPLKLGKDIQVAFTSKEHVSDLEKLLSPFGIEVLDIDTAKYLETMNMIRGSRNLEMQKQNLPPQQIISTILQQDILPHYATPFPERPTYLDESTHQRIEVNPPFYGSSAPTYAAYIEQVNQGTLLPRSIHGTMHASRVALWTQLLFNLNQTDQAQKLEGIDPIWLAVTGGAHDICRQDEGKDRWDRESSLFIQSYLQALGIDSQAMKRFAFALAEKDPKDGNFTDPIQAIIHDADCLEINRVLKNPKKEFKKSELRFFHLQTLSPDEKEAILNEVQLFIAWTEKADVKMYLERNSQNYYGDLMRLMAKLHQERGCFPQLTHWLEKEIKAFNDKEADPALVALISE